MIKTLYQNDKRLFSYPFILRGTLRALIFPFLIALVSNVRQGEFDLRITVLIFFLIACPLLLLQFVSTLRRCRYTLREIYIDESSNAVSVGFNDCIKEEKIQSNLSDFSVIIRHDNWMKYAYVLEFRVKNESAFKQCQEGYWNEEKMFELVRTLSNNSIKCICWTTDIKQQVWNE